MGAVTVRASGRAGVDEAWARYADTTRWARWAPQIRRVETDGGATIRPGLTGRVHPIVGPAVSFVIEDVDADARQWTWRVRFGPLRLRLTHAVLPTATGAGTTLRIEGPWPLIVAYAPLARVALGRLSRRERGARRSP